MRMTLKECWQNLSNKMQNWRYVTFDFQFIKISLWTFSPNEFNTNLTKIRFFKFNIFGAGCLDEVVPKQWFSASSGPYILSIRGLFPFNISPSNASFQSS